ncbi:MAG: S9 family peptidase, partial [Luteimonas sp.]
MAAALSNGNVHAGQTPIEAFTQHAQYSEARISPNGKYLAMTVDEQGRNLLVVLNLSDMAIVHTVRLADEKSVAEFAWAGPERLVFDAARNVGSYAQPFLTGEWYAVNADGSQGRTLLAYNVAGGSIGQTKQISYTDGYSLLHPLPEDPGQILMTVSSAASTQVVSVDTMSGQRRVLAKIAKGGCSFALDVSHQPNMAVCSDDRGENGTYEINSQLYRVDGGGRWNLMSDSRTSGERIVVLDSAPDGRVYAIADDRKLPAAFGLLDGSTGQFKKLFQDPVSDPARFIVGSDGHTILAVVTAAGVPHIEMVDANSPDTKLYASLANSFP